MSDGSGGDGDESQSGDRETSTAEKAVMVVSVLFTLSLVAYGGWQMATTPNDATPSTAVVETESLASGDVAVTVRLTNPGDVGLVSVTVEADCSRPPPDVQLTYVPASSTRRATLVCPPETTSPNVSVADWVTA